MIAVVLAIAAGATACGDGLPKPPDTPPTDISGVVVATQTPSPTDDGCIGVPNHGFVFQPGQPVRVERPTGVFTDETEVIAASVLTSRGDPSDCEFTFELRGVRSQLNYHIYVGTHEWLVAREDIERFGWRVRLFANDFDCEGGERPKGKQGWSCYGPGS